jgi:hypothetical protein
VKNIGPEWTNLAEGLLRVEALEARFHKEWGPRFEVARRKVGEAERQKYRKRGRTALVAAAVLGLLLFVLALVLSLISRLGRGQVTADLKDGSDEADDSAYGRNYGLYHRTRRSARPRVGPTECGGGFTVDRLVFGAGDAFRAPPFSLFVQVAKEGTRDED